MNKQQRVRFIAGAVCPKCQAMDVIKLHLDSEDIECVACGFRQTSAESEAGRNSNPVGDIAIKRVD